MARPGHGRAVAACHQPPCGLGDGTVFHTGHEVDDRAALARPEVVPEVLVVADAEAGGALLAQRREVHAAVALFPLRDDPPCREIGPDADTFYFVVGHGVEFL